MLLDIQQIITQVSAAKNQFLIRKGQAENLRKTRDELLRRKADNEDTLTVYEQAKLLLAESSRVAKTKVKTQLEKLVTSGLQFVFGPDLRFEIDIIESKNRTEAEFYIVSSVEGREIRTDPENNNGGSVVDMVSLILRIAILQATSPTMQGPLILDEPFTGVSIENIVKVGEFMQKLQDFFGRQVIVATHNAYLAELADKKFVVTQADGLSGVSVA